MQPTQNLEPKTIEEMLDAHLELLATNPEAYADLLIEDVLWNFRILLPSVRHREWKAKLPYPHNPTS